LFVRCLAEVVPDDMAKYGNSSSDWRPDGCDQDLAVAEGSPNLEDRLENSMYNEPTDAGTGAWAENVTSGWCEAGASGWVGNGFRNVDTNDGRQNGPGPGDSPVTDCLPNSTANTDRHSHQFSASVVVNTGNQERCEC